jgi:hypothetical protein
MLKHALAALAAALVAGQAVAAPAQDPCASFFPQAAQLAGMADAKPETLKSGKNIICDIWSKDRSVHAMLTASPDAQPASTLAFRATLAKKAKDPDLSVKDEPSLGSGAFQLRGKNKLDFNVAGKENIYAISLIRDNGIGAGDEDRMRAIAKKVAGGP